MTIMDLINKRAAAWNAAKAFMDAHTSENGIMSAEDCATYDRMEKEITDYTEQINRMQRQRDIEDSMGSPVDQPLTAKPEAAEVIKNGTAANEYGKSFWKMMRNKNLEHGVYNALQVGTDSEGGYLVPDEFEKMIIQGLQEENVIRMLATKIRTSNGTHKIPVVSSHGSAGWISEEGSYTESDEAFTQVTLDAHKLGTLMKVSEELLNDSAFNLDAYIAAEFARRAGALEESAFITGNGSGQPTGLTAATGGATVGVTAASAASFTADELLDLYYALKAPYRAKAVFVLNNATVKAVRKLKDGNGNYLWQPALAGGQPDRLLNAPVYTSAYMPTISTGAKVILYGDMSYYWIADRSPVAVRRLDELYAANGQVGFRLTERVDGKLVLAEAVQCLKMG